MKKNERSKQKKEKKRQQGLIIPDFSEYGN